MARVDPGVDDRNLRPCACCTGAAFTAPRVECIDQRQVGVEAMRGWRVETLEFGPLNHRRRLDRRERRSVQLHRHRVQREVELARDTCVPRIVTEPLLELVPQLIQLRPVRPHGVAGVVDLLALCGLCARRRGYRISLQLDERCRGVHTGSPRAVSGGPTRASRGNPYDEKACKRRYCGRRQFAPCHLLPSLMRATPATRQSDAAGRAIDDDLNLGRLPRQASP